MWDGFCSHLCHSLNSLKQGQLCLSFPFCGLCHGMLFWGVLLKNCYERETDHSQTSISELYLCFFRLTSTQFFMWGIRLEVALVSDELEAEPESCPSFTPLIQRQPQGGMRLSRVSEQSWAAVCTCCDSCSKQKKSYAFAACSSSGVRMLASLIFSGFYSAFQALTVTRSVNLKLVMTVDAGKTHASGNIFFSPLLFPCLKFVWRGTSCPLCNALLGVIYTQKKSV